MSGLRVALLLLAALVAMPARATECKIEATAIRFGGYDVFSPTALQGRGSLSIYCNPTHKTFSVVMEPAPSDTGNISRRALLSAKGDRLYYSVYTNPGLSVPLDRQMRVVTKLAPWFIELYAEIGPQQRVPVGTYTDQIQISIYY